jgi:FKBP-type peptidyl-prolyl cis-trans isomerase
VSKKHFSARLAAIAVAATIALVAFAAAGCSTSAPAATTSEPPAGGTAAPQPAPSAEASGAVTELKIEDLKVGKGEAAKAGDTIVVNYTGWLTDGTQFDSSVGKAPLTFPLGTGYVIPGWDQGVAGMKVGGVRKLTIPPDLAYGAAGAGNGAIPPNATLVFEIELLKIQ